MSVLTCGPRAEERSLLNFTRIKLVFVGQTTEWMNGVFRTWRLQSIYRFFHGHMALVVVYNALLFSIPRKNCFDGDASSFLERRVK